MSTPAELLQCARHFMHSCCLILPSSALKGGHAHPELWNLSSLGLQALAHCCWTPRASKGGHPRARGSACAAGQGASPHTGISFHLRDPSGKLREVGKAAPNTKPV